VTKVNDLSQIFQRWISEGTELKTDAGLRLELDAWASSAVLVYENGFV
jgi:hypothetical protein